MYKLLTEKLKRHITAVWRNSWFVFLGKYFELQHFLLHFSLTCRYYAKRRNVSKHFNQHIVERPIFELLVEISKKDFADLADHSGESNRDQRIREIEKRRKLNYLLSQGLISKTEDIYIITEYGFIVAQYKSWSKYLSHQKELINRKQLKENLDLKISEFQVRTKFLPYYISLISIIISVIALTNPFESKIKSVDSVDKHQQKKTKNQPNKLVDSSKVKVKTSANSRLAQ